MLKVFTTCFLWLYITSTVNLLFLFSRGRGGERERHCGNIIGLPRVNYILDLLNTKRIKVSVCCLYHIMSLVNWKFGILRFFLL